MSMCAFIGMSPGAPEMILIFVVMLLLFGAKNLPGIARNIGRTIEEFRRAAHDVTSEIMNAEDGDDSYMSPTARPPKSLEASSSSKPKKEDDDGAG